MVMDFFVHIISFLDRAGHSHESTSSGAPP
jgi:hypothetical protein